MNVEIHLAHREREEKISLLSVIGDTLRAERNERGLTLRQVAEGAHVSVSYLAEIERGEKDPSSRVLESIASGLDMETSDLLIRVALTLGPVTPVHPVAESLAA
jgi:transcriptional regulator with XRE-family HTH domain